MGGQVAEREPKGQKGGRRKKRRISILIDMTPMVDIAFLLLIFYMVSTVFSMPQAMEINLPPDDGVIIEMKESNLLTLRVDGESRFWWNVKTPSPDNLPVMLPSSTDKPDTVAYVLDADTLRGLLTGQNRENSKLSTLILIHKEATYADMVNILDEIDLIERSWNQFTADQLGKEVSDLTKDEKFSYRYAMGDWEDRDDKIQSAAVEAAIERGDL